MHLKVNIKEKPTKLNTILYLFVFSFCIYKVDTNVKTQINVKIA